MHFLKSTVHKLKSLTKIEFANILVTIFGITMIVCSTLISVERESIEEKLLSLLGDLGIGLLPTGVLGFVIERIQNRNKEREKNNKRSAILRLFNNALHGYLNVICNAAIAGKGCLKGENIFEIINALNSELHIEHITDEKEAIQLVVERLQMCFETRDPLFIVADVFETIEINHFELILQEGKNLLRLLHNNEKIGESRSSFLSYLQVACSEIPEFRNYMKMVSDGDNIYTPKKD